MRFRLFFSLICLTAFSLFVSAAGLTDETLKYTVSYKWGLIHKDAGTATLTLRNNGFNYNLKLTAASKPWADKIYKVRDTLLSTVSKQGFRPRSYTRIAHEDNKYSRDHIAYSYSGNKVTATATRMRQRDDGMREVHTTLSANGAAYDLLSVFYYLRLIDYSKLGPGKVVVTTLFSGKQSENVRIKAVGVETIKLKDKTKVKALHIKFNFTTAGKKKSSEDIDAWLSDDSRHIPLLVVGSLPVGQIRCYLTSKI